MSSLTTKYIEIQNVEQTFKTKKGPFCALQDINLTVAKGEFVALIGHSGCGKSTLLNLLAGLTMPTQGTLLCANREIAGPGPERAGVFQNHSLLPRLTCFENVYLAVERVFAATENKAHLKARTDAALAMVGLTAAAQKRPGEISGGMKQRVGLARALAADTDVILMDEAFSALDPLIRADMQDQLLQLEKNLSKTIVFITHDLDEALRIGAQIAILKDGKLVQVGTPDDILNRPANDYVARFVQRRTGAAVAHHD
ncbi:ATP-binding cassette domain-containing protein [Agrobacterium sp.]|uniref:ATP-binding cassette domain-containing protein n=1 Tax=Agrobacterium sp. TaxID=361 RepID=UPI0040337E84